VARTARPRQSPRLLFSRLCDLLRGTGERYQWTSPIDVDLDHCKVCGLCVEECPTGSMTMEPEDV
jgi:ferredoxin